MLITGTRGRGAIQELREYSNLEKLEIMEIRLTEDEIRTVFASLAEMHVQELALASVIIVGGDLCTFFPLFAECPSLRELRIEYISIRDPNVVYDLLQLPLTLLGLANVDLDDRCAEKIALAMYQNRTPRILKLQDNVDITAAGLHMIARALEDNTSLVGLDVSESASEIMVNAIRQSGRIHFVDTLDYDDHPIDHMSIPDTIRFVSIDSDDIVSTWPFTLSNLVLLVFARFPVENHTSVLHIALDQTALHQKAALWPLSDVIYRTLRGAIFDAGATDPNLDLWMRGRALATDAADFADDDEKNDIHQIMYREVKRMESVNFDRIPDIRVLHPFRNEVLKLSATRPTGGVLVHSVDADWQARLADAAGATVLVCVPDDANAAVFEALALRHAARNYVVAIIGNDTSKTMGVAERYLPAARHVFAAPDVAGAIAAAEKHVDRTPYTIRDLLVYRECLASDELLLTFDEADSVAMRCGFGPGNWARVARFPGVWTLPGVGVAPDAGRFLAHLDKWLAPTSGAVLATAWPAREGAAFAARLRDFLVSPVHLAKIVREANELVAVPSVDAVVDALAALGVVHRVAGNPLLVVRGSRPDALAALHARLLSRPDEFQRVVLRDGVIDFQHAGGRYTADAADAAVRVTGAGGRLVPLALRQALQIDPRAAAAAKRRAL